MAKRKRKTVKKTEQTAPPPRELIDQLKTWLIEGQTVANVTEAAATIWPEKANKLADCLQLVAADLAADGNMDPDTLRGWTANAYREIYRRGLETGDLATALKAAQLLAKI